MKEERLSSLRNHIEDIDTAIYQLLEQRTHYALAIAEQKRIEQKHLFDPQQEHKKLEFLTQKNPHYLYIAMEVMAFSRTLQGSQCYVLQQEDIPFAKIALGLATPVHYRTQPTLPKEETKTSFFFVSEHHCSLLQSLFTLASYSITYANSTYIYYTMATQQNDVIPTFSIIL